MLKYEIKLTPKERQTRVAMVSKGRNQAVVIRRGHSLLKSDEGKTDREISDQLYIDDEAVRRTRLRFCAEGVDSALVDKPGRGSSAKLDERQEAHLTALACTEPPDGRARWTLEITAQRLVEEGVIDQIAPETVRQILKNISQALAGQTLVHRPHNACVSISPHRMVRGSTRQKSS